LGLKGAAAENLDAAVAKKTAIPTAERGVAAQWQAWRAQQHFTGDSAVPDFADPEQMNRYTWYQAHNWKVPYPGDTRIYAPSQVPGAYVPSVDTN
jgi:hypothetical protein